MLLLTYTLCWDLRVATNSLVLGKVTLALAISATSSLMVSPSERNIFNVYLAYSRRLSVNPYWECVVADSVDDGVYGELRHFLLKMLIVRKTERTG